MKTYVYLCASLFICVYSRENCITFSPTLVYIIYLFFVNSHYLLTSLFIHLFTNLPFYLLLLRIHQFVEGAFSVSGGQVEFGTDTSKACYDEIYKATMYDSVNATECTAVTELSGLTLNAGVYCSESITIAAGLVTLDGKGNSDAQFIFQATNNVTTSEYSSFLLTNGALPRNVFWAVGDANIAGSSLFVGMSSMFFFVYSLNLY